MATTQGPEDHAAPSKKVPRWTKVVIVILIAVAAIGAVVGAVVLATPAHANLRVVLSATLQNDVYDFGIGPGGTVSFYGRIYNYGEASGSGTIHFQIYDGKSWYNYNVTTGVVPAKDSRWFGWDVHFDYLDTFNARIHYTVTAVL